MLLCCRNDALVRSAIEALLTAWRAAGEQEQKLELRLRRLARASDTGRCMATIPGVGAITALTFVATMDDPVRFSRSADVGAFLDLTLRRYQSGDVDLIGRISKFGDRTAQSLCSKLPT